mmetsp:Transcript_72854/g.202049  ORF Transcript_72854/g.202049 Transcript_72854/m.202049 type:complete len:380 (-) Transcript_72854:266-1405(-)
MPPKKRLRDAPISTGEGLSCSTRLAQCLSKSKLCRAVFAKPMPGSSIMFQEGTPTRSAARRLSCKWSLTSRTTEQYVASEFMFCGVPFMCIRTMGAINSAAAASMSASYSPAETSLIQSAPAATAARATAALRVSTLIVTFRFFARIARTMGTTRRISSSAITSAAPGRVDSPPTSRIWAPASTMACAVESASSTLKLSPPSLKESGVAFNMPMIKVSCPRRHSGPPSRPCKPPAAGMTWNGHASRLAPKGRSAAEALLKTWSMSATVGCDSRRGCRHEGHSSAMGTRTKSRSWRRGWGTSRGYVPLVTVNCVSPTATMSRSTTRGPFRLVGVRPTSASMAFKSVRNPCKFSWRSAESSSSATAFKKEGWSVSYCGAVL